MLGIDGKGSVVFFSHTVTEMNKVDRVKRKLMFEELTSTKVLEINIPNSKLGYTLITEIVQVLQKQAAHHQTDGNTWYASL
jgi:broad specificity polyphosphatase/5'/3'-nucleotidase SurE